MFSNSSIIAYLFIYFLNIYPNHRLRNNFCSVLELLPIVSIDEIYQTIFALKVHQVVIHILAFSHTHILASFWKKKRAHFVFFRNNIVRQSKLYASPKKGMKQKKNQKKKERKAKGFTILGLFDHPMIYSHSILSILLHVKVQGIAVGHGTKQSYTPGPTHTHERHTPARARVQCKQTLASRTRSLIRCARSNPEPPHPVTPLPSSPSSPTLPPPPRRTAAAAAADAADDDAAVG